MSPESPPSTRVVANLLQAQVSEEAILPAFEADSQLATTLETIGHVRMKDLISIHAILLDSKASEDRIYAKFISKHYLNPPIPEHEQTRPINTEHALHFLFESFRRAKSLSNNTVCADEWPFFTTNFKKLTRPMIKRRLQESDAYSDRSGEAASGTSYVAPTTVEALSLAQRSIRPACISLLHIHAAASNSHRSYAAVS